MHEAPEVEEEKLKSSFKYEVAAFRWSSKAFLSKSMTNAREFEAWSSVLWELESEVSSLDVIETLIELDSYGN